jgi:ribosome biogenesis protein UTP30
MKQLIINNSSVDKALDNLIDYENNNHIHNSRFGFERTRNLKSTETFFSMIVSVKEFRHPSKKKDPIRLTLPHPLYCTPSIKICLLVKDNQIEFFLEKKKFCKYENICKITKIIDISKLRLKYESFEARRKLCASYDLFLADDRIIPMLPNLIGKVFYKKRKIPIPVRIGHNERWEREINRAISGTTLFFNEGNCLNIKVGKMSQSQEDVHENVISVVEQVIKLMSKSNQNLQGIFLKTKSSTTFPVY